jgi:anti-sigma-K factor RskA
MDRSELLDLIPAYALDALDPEEKLQVEVLLHTDAEAQKLLAEYQDITSNLILATPARRAPAHLERDLRKRLVASRPAQTAPTPISTPAEPPVTILPSRRRTNIWLPLVAAAAVIAIVFGAVTLLNRNPAERLYNQIVAMPDHLTMPIPSPDGTTPDGEMVATADGKQAVLRLTRLPELNSDSTFQLWLIDANGAHSGGLFPFTGSTSTYYVIVPLTKGVFDYNAFGVSVEPEGGSPSPDGPSTTPIVVISTT